MVNALRPRDTVNVELEASLSLPGGGAFDNFTTLEVVNNITGPSEASFESGDDISWAAIGDVFAIGTKMKVFVNDRLRITGRVELNNAPFDPHAGAVIRFAVRTKLADAFVAGANPSTAVQNVSIKDFIVKLYEPMGYVAADFVFDPRTYRNLMTGLAKHTSEVPVDLEPIKLPEARVTPPETIYAAADRHLRRHGLMHWDMPDGRIMVGAPNDTQDPTYTFNAFRSYPSAEINNILGASRTRDWSGIPGRLTVFGVGGKRDFTKTRVSDTASDDDVLAAGFYRPVQIVAEGIRSKALALSAAQRELSARSKRKDGYQINLDGLSHWVDGKQVQYSPDTVALIHSDVAGGTSDPYYVQSVVLTRSAAEGDTTQMDLVKRGIWRL